MSIDYEMRVMEYEQARNEAEEEWFGARVGRFNRDGNDRAIFDGGFRKGRESIEDQHDLLLGLINNFLAAESHMKSKALCEIEDFLDGRV